jgi:Peptidase M50B-like
VLATAVVALAVVVWSPVWRVGRHVVTLVHEGSHGVVALACGRRLAGIRLHSDSSGLTVSHGRARGLGMVATFLAGYSGPALVGLGAASLLSTGHAAAVLWFVLVVLGWMLLQIRNLYGLWVVLACAVVLVLATWWLDPVQQTLAASVLTWFLLLAAPRAVWDLQTVRARGLGGASDADQLARLTFVPAILWVLFFFGVTLSVAAVGALLLLPAPS